MTNRITYSPIPPSPHAEILGKLPVSATVREVAATLGVSVRSVERWIQAGQLAALKIGKSVRVPRAAVAAYLAGCAQ